MEPQKNTTTEPKKAIGPRSLRKDVTQRKNTGSLEVYAYALKVQGFGEFHVLSSANAWWTDIRKVEKLIDAWKLECTDEQAWFYADISKGQYDYFRELHPQLSYVKQACKQNLGLYARQHFAKRVIRGDDDAVMTYLKKNHKAEFAGQLDVTSGGEKLNTTNAIVFVDFSETVTTEPYVEPAEEKEPEQLPSE